MAKFEKFISQKYLPISEEEKQEFIKRISTLVEKYDKALKMSIPFRIADKRLFIRFKADKTRKFRDTEGNRVSFDGIGFMISKSTGYIDNFDWCKMECIDKTKPEKDYDSAPPFQYSATMWVEGEKIPFSCRKGYGITNGEMYQYGTEFDDIDFYTALWQLYNQELKPMEK